MTLSNILAHRTVLLTTARQFAVRYLAMAFSYIAMLPRKTQIYIIPFAAIFVLAAIQDPGFIFIPGRKLTVGIFAMTCCTFTSYLILATKEKLASSKVIHNCLDAPPRKDTTAE